MKTHFLRAFGCRFFSTAAGLISGMASLWLYKKFLTPSTYGGILVAVQIMAYLSLVDGGFRTTVNRSLLAEKDWGEKRRQLRFSQTFYSWLSLLIIFLALAIMLGYCFTPNAQMAQGTAFFLALGLAGAVALIGGVQNGLLIGLGAQAKYFVLNGLSSCTTVLTLWLSFRSGAGIWAFPISTFAGFVLTFAVGCGFIRRIVPDFRPFSFTANPEFWHYFHQFKNNAWSCFRSQIAIMFLFTLDVVLVGMVCKAEEVAIYGILGRLFAILRNFLQTASEVAWPIIAQKGSDHGQFMQLLPRINAWTYGCIMGALCITLGPFLEWFMGKVWTPPTILVGLLAVRFLITGVSSPASYFLMGLGEFRIIAKLTERELIAAVLSATLLGMYWGMIGVSVGFLISTWFGSLFPLLTAYARVAKMSNFKMISQVWCRAAAGFALSFLLAQIFIRNMEKGANVIFIAVMSVCVPLLCVSLFSYLRCKYSRPLIKLTLSDIIGQI